jgi:citrate lyase subunit beta / citryl-CoA lyase
VARAERSKMTKLDPRVGEAGPRGDGVRGDAYARVELGGDALQLDVQSKVGGLYGAAIEADLRSVLERLGVVGAQVMVADRGALPAVLRARIEAAALRAGVGAAEAPLFDAPVATAFDRRRRSRLYLPGNQPKFMTNAGLYGGDGIIFDLEDSVHPDEKDAARILVRNVLCEWSYPGTERMVRINPGELGMADLDEIVAAQPDLLLLPKVECAEEVVAVAERVASIQSSREFERPLWLMPILESAQGIEAATEIARAHESIVAITLGLEDLTADLGVPKTDAGPETLYARSRVVMAANAVGVQPIDSVYGNVGDEEGLRRWAKASRAMGFVGMGCVHPRQIPVLHECFAPSPDEIEKARRIVEAFEAARAGGEAVVSLGSRMIDPPVVKRALAIVAQADEIVESSEEGGHEE